MADKKSKHRRNKQKKGNSNNSTGLAQQERTQNDKNNKSSNKASNSNKVCPTQITFTRMTRSKVTIGDGESVAARTSKTANQQRDGELNSTPSTATSNNLNSKAKDGGSSHISLFSAEPPGSRMTHHVSPNQSNTTDGTDPQVNRQTYTNPDDASKQQGQYKDVGPDILQTLAVINEKLQKLDALDSLTAALKEGLSGVHEKVEGVLIQVGEVKKDLQSCDAKWEASISALSERITKLERNSEGMDNKWEEYRTKVQKDISIIQPSIDSNSSRILELEEKWEALEAVEKKIKDAAEKKFKVVQKAIKQELQEEMQGGLKDSLKQELHEELVTNQKNPQTEDAQPSQYDRMRDQARRNRHNIILFGMADNESPDADLQDAQTFFSERMNLPRVEVENTYRLGQYGNNNSDKPRPLVVTFSNIKDRWAVWNRRGKIKFVKGVPIWLHEDLPKQLRNDNRVLQRIAKVARMNPELYGEVKVKDYTLNLNGQKYNMDNLHLLPKELSPHAVYSPRSESALVFFTRNSPFSNHFPSDFDLEGLSFSCVEQFLAVQRAFLSRDKPLARRAMEQKDPAEHKLILNKLRNDKLEEWRRNAPELISKALKAKFTQNSLLKDLLLSTYPLQIGEASKDTFWGVGLTLENQSVLDTDKWAPEGNLLGRTLMAIREDLMKP